MDSGPLKRGFAMIAPRFDDEDIEREYRRWRVNATLPYQQLGWLAGMASFLVAGVSAHYWMPGETSIPQLCFSVVPFFGLALLLSRMPALQRFSEAFAVIMNWVGGGVAMAAGGLISIAGAVLGAFAAGLYIPFMRHSPFMALLGGLPLTGAIVVMTVATHRAGAVSAGEAWLFVVFAAVLLLTVWIVALAHESITRMGFWSERIINSQKDALSRSNKLIKRYVPPAVAEQILIGNAELVDTPRRCRVTVLFADLVGFTEVADEVDPEALTEVVMGYMRNMSDLIGGYGGTLNEFSGDGIMAIFGAPASMAPETQVKSAIGAAQAMQAAMPELNAAWRRTGLSRDLAIRVGINSGTLSVGSFGSDGRMTYTGVGLQTNIAARIQAKCDPGHILISESSWQLIKEQVPCEPKGDIECKGVHFRIGVYEPV